MTITVEAETTTYDAYNMSYDPGSKYAHPYTRYRVTIDGDEMFEATVPNAARPLPMFYTGMSAAEFCYAMAKVFGEDGYYWPFQWLATRP